MTEIRVIDARMGRGKTSAAINYMSRMAGKMCFLYVTPYLKEVDRICDRCEFSQPSGDRSSKLTELKAMMYRGRNVATTHAMFYLLDEEVLSIAREKHYSIIIDESIDPVQRVPVTKKDLDIILGYLADVGEDGMLTWRDPDYDGKFDGYKEMADDHALYLLDTSLIYVMNPRVLEAFDQVIMMTYLFHGQYQRAYLDYFGIPYRVCGIRENGGYTTSEFSEEKDAPPPTNYFALLSVLDDPVMNEIGDARYSLSKAWYDRRGRADDSMTRMRRNLAKYFKVTHSQSTDFMWTCFKSDMSKLLGQRNRFANSFLQLTSRASNEYRNRSVLAYLVNRFVDPNIEKFFSQKGIEVDQDQFALGELLQWIWRSAIRDDKPVTIYIPSRRMRALLKKWIYDNSKGGETSEGLAR